MGAAEQAVTVVEVGPRDGLQNEKAALPTDDKLALVEALHASGLPRIELSSFVSPRRVPQLADASALCSEATKRWGTAVFSALCPNGTGLKRAKEAGLGRVAVFLSASPTHNRRNVGKSIEATLRTFDAVIEPALQGGMQVRGYVSTVWGCPFEGAVEVRRVAELATVLLERGCYEVSLGDTLGLAAPKQIREVLKALLPSCPAERLALHLHDTRGTALANVFAGLELGLRTFDASIAGLGGCPFAPGAAGNLATEDLVYALDREGLSTGVDGRALWEAGQVAELKLGRALPGKVHQAGLPPDRTAIGW